MYNLFHQNNTLNNAQNNILKWHTNNTENNILKERTNLFYYVKNNVYNNVLK